MPDLPLPSMKVAVERFQERLILTRLVEFGGNRTAAARSLSITREGLYRMMVRLGMTDHNKQRREVVPKLHA